MKRLLPVLVIVAVIPLLTACPHTKYDTLNVDSMEDFESIYPEHTFKFTDEMDIRYVKAGQGYPIIFLHGLGGDHHQWKLNMPYFDKRFSVYALDFPGHGKTGFAKGHPYSITNHAKAVVELMKHEDLDKAVIVGNSMGGHVALHLAVNHPKRVKRLVLADPAGGSPFNFYDYYISKFFAHNPPFDFVDEGFIRYRGRSVVEQNSNHPILENFIRKKLLIFRNSDKLELYKGMFKDVVLSIINSDVHEKVDAIEKPTLIIWGENDKVIDPSYGMELHKKMRSSYLKIYPNTGHVAPIERPEWFNQQIHFFLRDLSRKPTTSMTHLFQ